jgi:hypothetical protein
VQPRTERRVREAVEPAAEWYDEQVAARANKVEGRVLAAAQPRPKVVQPVDSEHAEEPRPRQRTAQGGKGREKGQLAGHDSWDGCTKLRLSFLRAEQLSTFARVLGVDLDVRQVVHEVAHEVERQGAVGKAEPKAPAGEELEATSGGQQVEPQRDEVVVGTRNAKQ